MGAKSLIVFSDYEGKQVEIWADSASDIPTAKTDWVAGSIAFAIDTGVFYVLNSSGVWVNQDDSSVLSTVSTNSVSPAVSPSVLEINKGLLSGVQADVETFSRLKCISNIRKDDFYDKGN